MGWHADDEKELGKNPTIAALSFGGERDLVFKNTLSKETLAVPQLSGALIIIDGQTQKYWQHSIKKTKKFISPRINLTFRNIMFQKINQRSFFMKERVKVVVTGAAGQISYSLIPRLVDGHTFGDKIVDLELVEIPQVVEKLEGLVMELEDSNFPNMGNVNYTSDFESAAKDADWFLLVGSIPRGIVYNGKKIEERADLLQINGGIFVGQGKAIGEHGKPMQRYWWSAIQQIPMH